MMRRMAGPNGPGGQIFNVGKSKAHCLMQRIVKTTFDNVAGLDEQGKYKSLNSSKILQNSQNWEEKSLKGLFDRTSGYR